MVHDALQALARRPRRLGAGSRALCLCGLLAVLALAGCGGSSHRANDGTGPGVGASIRSDNCSEWLGGSLDQRRSTIVQLREFAGSAVGSSAGIQHGHVLDDDRAYTLMQSFCVHRFARGFKLYKLYERAAAFIGH